MPVNLKKGQKVSLTKDNPGLTRVVVGLGWDVNALTPVGPSTWTRLPSCWGTTARPPAARTLCSTATRRTPPAGWSTWATT